MPTNTIARISLRPDTNKNFYLQKKTRAETYIFINFHSFFLSPIQVFANERIHKETLQNTTSRHSTERKDQPKEKQRDGTFKRCAMILYWELALVFIRNCQLWGNREKRRAKNSPGNKFGHTFNLVTSELMK